MSNRSSSGIPLWLSWALVTCIGFALGFQIDHILGGLLSFKYGIGFMGSISYTVFAGLLIGVGQWLILRSRFKWAWAWPIATALGYPIGYGIGFFVVFLGLLEIAILIPQFFANDLIQFVWNLISGCFAGFFIGIFQWLSLRTKSHGMFKWVLVSMLSWAIGIGFSQFFTLLSLQMGTVGHTDWLGGLVFSPLIGATIGVINGAFVKSCIFNLSVSEADVNY
jgi:hypothetical protein